MHNLQDRDVRPISSAADFKAAFGVPRETIDLLITYEALLKQWQRTINLVAPSTLDSVWHRHFADSAQLLAFAPDKAEHWLDLGSGAGFPGLVLAILLREKNPKARVMLCESDTRKAAFLREVARQTGTVVDIYAGRIENLSTQAKVPKVDVVTARALASLAKLLELSRPFFGPTTKGLFLKGAGAVREVEEAKASSFAFDCELHPSLTDSEARIAVIANLRPQTEG